VLHHHYRNLVVLIGLITLAGFFLGGFSTSQASASINIEHAIHLPIVFKKDFDLIVADVQVIQGTTVSESYSVHIADRDTFVRVFVGTGSGKKVTGVSGGLCGYDAQGSQLGCIEPQNDPIVAPSTESNIEGTINFKLPFDWVKPGYAYHVILDPDNVIHESNRTNNRFPIQGIQPFNFTVAPALNMIVLPVIYKPFPTDNTFLPEIGNLAYLTWMPTKVLPIPVATYQIHIPYFYFPTTSELNLDNSTGAGWLQLLLELTSIHNLEDPTGTLNYYGVVNSFDAHGCDYGCISGVSNLGATGGLLTGVGWSGYGAGTNEASRTLVHELGHNFGRAHVNCSGIEPKPDLNYPYPGGSIGQWGLDVMEGILYDPEIFADYMSYCPDVWTSDYTYWNIYSYRKAELNQAVDPPQIRTLYISGYQTPDGQVHLEPIYEQVSPFTGFPTGNYRVEMLGDRGVVLASYPFRMIEVADITGSSNFGFFVPAIAGLQGVRILEGDQILAEKFAHGEIAVFPAGRSGVTTLFSEESLTLDWTDLQRSGEEIFYRLRLSQNQGRSWQVLALKLRTSSFSMPIEPGMDLSQAIFEVQASDGIQTSTAYFSTYGE